MDVALGSTPDRDLAALALDIMGWNPQRAEAINADPAAALARLEAMLVPAKDAEPGGLVDGQRGPKTDKLVKALALLGAKIAPTLPQQQMQAWIAALVTALSDLPFAFSVKGAEKAVHIPMQFLNEVEKVVREQASYARVKHDVATMRLKAFQRRVARTSAPALPAPEHKDLTVADIRAMPERLRKLGLTLGHITQEQYDEAERTTDE